MFNNDNNSKSSSMLDKFSYTYATNEWNVVTIMYSNQLNFNKALGLGAAPYITYTMKNLINTI